MRVLVYGGSFNPPHAAHVFTVFHALNMLKPDKVLVIPTFQHPDGKALLSYEHRLHMCELAFASVPRVTVSRIEEELKGTSYTLRTLEALQGTHPDWEITLLIGSDVREAMPSWADFSEITENFSVYPIGRMSFHPQGLSGIVPDISSTEIRRLLGEGNAEAVEGMVYPDVLEYILEKGLYDV